MVRSPKVLVSDILFEKCARLEQELEAALTRDANLYIALVQWATQDMGTNPQDPRAGLLDVPAFADLRERVMELVVLDGDSD